MKKVGSYQQVKPVTPPKKTTERKTPLSQPGTFNQQAMDNAKPIYSGNSSTGRY